jgi:hypothetical protein
MILDSKNNEGHEVSTLDNLEQDTVDKNPEKVSTILFSIRLTTSRVLSGISEVFT